MNIVDSSGWIEYIADAANVDRISHRMTVVLEQRGDERCLTQTKISLPAPGPEEGNSVPV